MFIGAPLSRMKYQISLCFLKMWGRQIWRRRRNFREKRSMISLSPRREEIGLKIIVCIWALPSGKKNQVDYHLNSMRRQCILRHHPELYIISLTVGVGMSFNSDAIIFKLLLQETRFLQEYPCINNKWNLNYERWNFTIYECGSLDVR